MPTDRPALSPSFRKEGDQNLEGAGGAGVREATIEIVNNDSDENPFDFAVIGEGADLTSPAVTSYTPEDDSADIALDTDLALIFNETIQKGTGNIIIKKTDDDSIVETIDVNGAQVLIDTTAITDDTVTIDTTSEDF